MTGRKQAWQGSCKYDYTADDAACTRHMKAQASHNPRVQRGGGYKVQDLAKELLTVDTCGRKVGLL